MATLTHAIRSFQRGGSSPAEFLAQIDDALVSDRKNSAELLDILSEENTKFPLPPDVYAEVQRRIEHRGTGEQPVEETRMRTEQFVPPPPFSPQLGRDSGERIKGVGDTLNGRFELKECLGVGGMGTVYKALDLRKLEASDRNPYIAIKVLNVQFRGHPKSLIALQREAKKAQTLAHPNIVTVYDFDRDGAMVYLTMEYLSGQPLNRLLRAPGFNGMPYAKAMRIVDGMARALAYAHQRGFVHCDFKPANVFLTDSGEVKVIDFGIARVFQRPEVDTEATVFDPGSLGALTPAYASPEMLEHREPDPRDDIYALGCITYELLTGRHPFGQVAATQARSAGMKAQPPVGLSGRKWKALKAALSFEREARTPSVNRFLQEIGDDEGAASTRKFALGAGAAAVAVAVAAVGVYLAGRDGDSEQAVPLAAAPAAETEPPAAAPPPPPVALSLAAVAPVLAGIPCSALAARVNGGELRVEGYLPERYGIDRLKQTLGSLPGLDSLVAEVQLVGDDKCGVVDMFAPHWRRNREAGTAATVATKGARTQLSDGEYLIVDLKTPGFDSYVNVDYYGHDGGVVHLVPSPRLRESQAPANYSATIGSMGNWVVSKPFGTELIVLLVTPERLFEGLRPETESRADYLKALQARLAQVADKHGPERIAVDFVQITTSPRK